ncbi:MAG: DNA-binding protein [Rheinheimera sp.]
MARTGITKDDVRAARQRLMDEGQSVTLDSLRIELGNTGSKSTIQRCLRELENDDSTVLHDEQLLTDTIKTTVLQLARQLQEEALAKIAQADAVHESAQENWQNLTGKLRIQVLDLKEQTDDLQLKLLSSEDSNKKLLEARQQDALKISELNGENTHLKSLLDTKEQHISSLEDKHQHARQSLEHYRTSVQTQREQDEQRHEHQIQQLQADLRVAQQTVIVKQHEASTLMTQVQHLTTTLQHVQTASVDMKEQLVSLQAERRQLERQLEHRNTLYVELQKAFDLKCNELQQVQFHVSEAKATETILLQDNAALTAALVTQQQLWQQFSPLPKVDES